MRREIQTFALQVSDALLALCGAGRALATDVHSAGRMLPSHASIHHQAPSDALTDHSFAPRPRVADTCRLNHEGCMVLPLHT